MPSKLVARGGITALRFPSDTEHTDEVAKALRGGWLAIPPWLPLEPSPV